MLCTSHLLHTLQLLQCQGIDAGHSTSTRQLLATTELLDAAAHDYLCRHPIAPSNRKHCAALFRTLDRCRRLFGRFTLRCTDKGATACSTSLAQVQRGRCSALSLSRGPRTLQAQDQGVSCAVVYMQQDGAGVVRHGACQWVTRARALNYGALTEKGYVYKCM